MSGTLYIVATPIGNLEDMTFRAVRTLQEVDLIAVEDTRHSQKLLQHYLVSKPLISLHEHNEAQRVEQILHHLSKNQKIALISDAGTPLISDPGYSLVNAVRNAGFKVTPIPGACAAITALSVAGLPTNHFTFEGFLPAKQLQRCKYLQNLVTETRTIIFYESPHRLMASIADMVNIFGEQRQAAIAKELTKSFETIINGTLIKLQQWLNEDSLRQKGEFVILIHGAEQITQPAAALDISNLLDDLLAALPLKQAVQLAVKLTGERKNIIYEMALAKLQK